MRCLIVGAGGTGKSIARGLIKIKKISKIYIMNRTLESSKKAIKEINSSKTEIYVEGKSLPIDYVILTLCAVSFEERKKNARRSKNTYEIRQKELKINLLAVKDKLPFFRKLPKKVKILVVTNPVDAIENYLKKKLPGRKIFGFGLQLDINRYSKFLKKKIFGVGIHGKIVPSINLKKNKDYNVLYKKVDKSFLDLVRKKGLSYPIYAEEFRKYFQKLISDKKELIYTSANFKKSFCGIRDVSIGLPFYIQKGKILGIKEIKLNLVEQERLKKDAQVLKDSIKKYI
jgi:malate/lactate dehydrogenase